MQPVAMKYKCRVCNAAVSKFASACPLCGVARPVYESLLPIEKKYIDVPPIISGKFYYMLKSVNGLKDYGYNFFKEAANYFASPTLCFPLYLSLCGIVASLYLIATGTTTALPILLLMVSFGYAIMDLYDFVSSVTKALITVRLQVKGGASPYSVHFKIEEQLDQMLKTLSKLLYTFLETKPAYTTPMEQKAAESVLSAIKAITARIKKYAKISLETTHIIWRNNVYSLASDDKPETTEKELYINNKIREGEALILRYCWLNHLDTISDSIRNYLKSPDETVDFSSFKREIIEDNKLSTHGPLNEKFKTDYQSLPHELPFKMRYHMLEQLMPVDLPKENIIELFPDTKKFFESIAQVREMKNTVEQQAMIDKTAKVLSGIKSDNGMLSMEADDVKNTDTFSNFLDFSSFATNDDELQNQIDRLNAQLRI